LQKKIEKYSLTVVSSTVALYAGVKFIRNYIRILPRQRTLQGLTGFD